MDDLLSFRIVLNLLALSVWPYLIENAGVIGADATAIGLRVPPPGRFATNRAKDADSEQVAGRQECGKEQCCGALAG
jgi:hypothetical protein